MEIVLSMSDGDLEVVLLEGGWDGEDLRIDLANEERWLVC